MVVSVQQMVVYNQLLENHWLLKVKREEGPLDYKLKISLFCIDCCSVLLQAISQQDLVHMAIQIACGMSYLARREVIHKDLAARNCV